MFWAFGRSLLSVLGFARKILDLTIWSEKFPRARRTRREGVRVGVRGYVKAGVQWLYAQIRSDLSEHPFEAADGPGISVVSTGRRPLLRRLGVLGVLEIGGRCSPKMWSGPHFDTFGV